MNIWANSTKIVLLAVLLLAVISIVPRAEAKKTEDWDKVLQKGTQQLDQGNIEVAVKTFSEKVKKYPQSAACHTALGKALKRMGKLSDAKAEFRVATQIEPSYADSFYELGVVLEGDKEWAQAADAFDKYLLLKPDDGQRRTIEDRIRFCRGH